MPVIPDESTAVLWLETGDLGNTRPYQMDSSPDGSKLYVAMAGSNDGTLGSSDASIVEITLATKAIRTIVPDLVYVRGMTVHPTTGILYFADAPNQGGATATVSVWDPSTGAVTTHASLPALAYKALACDTVDDDWIWIKHGPSDNGWIRVYELSTGTLVYNTALPQFASNRSLAVTADYVYVTEADTPSGHLLDRALGTRIRTPAGSGHSNGVAGVSDTEFYLLSQWGHLVRYDGDADTSTTLVTGLPIPALTYENRGYGDIEITSGGRSFVSRGGWSADQGSITERDEPSGSDVGIYELGPGRGGWRIGGIGPIW